MKPYVTIILSAVSLVACGGGRRTSTRPAEPAEPVHYTYEVRNVYTRPATSYTQGLQYDDGLLWEGTGQHGASVVQTYDLATGRIEVLASLPRSEFGEGIALLDGKLYQLTWQSNTAHVYQTGDQLRKIRDFRYPGEGWGLTTDGRQLYLSNGSEYIYEVDPETFRRGRHFAVTLKGVPVKFLNELEWIEGKIWANVYTSDRIVIVDPATGAVEGIVDLSGLLPEEERTPETDVLNGIAYDPEGKRIFVTGKNWSRIFEIGLVKKD